MKNVIEKFVSFEASGGILLGFAALLALIMENSFLDTVYDGLLTTPVAIQIGQLIIHKPLLLWINDGLMAVFFLLVGLEIKGEIMEGQLSKRSQIALPTIAALGGLAAPAALYSYVNWGDPEALRGWAIPAATDIAFAYGVITLLGKRVPEALKVCLVAIAILDDLVAIVIIALFYTEDLSLLSLLIGLVAIIILAILNRRGVTRIAPYIATGVILWACVLKSGVHATLAGVILAFFIPLKIKDREGSAPLRKLEHDLHPLVTFVVLPIFAFANAGVPLAGLSLELLMHPITFGIAMGLFFGKQIGVMCMTVLGVMFKFCKLPDGVSWAQYYGMALITGIGFTMSLFIGTLAFSDVEYQNAVRLGVLLGSLLSGTLGFLVLRLVSRKPA